MNYVVLGDGISGYIIASYLKNKHKKVLIYGNGKYNPPSILILKCNNINDIKKYFKIFGIKYNSKNIKKFVRPILIGYTDDYCKTIYNIPTEEMKKNYLLKQKRNVTVTAMSDSLNSFLAIDLKLVYEYLKKKLEKNVIYADIEKWQFENIKNCKVYNTIFETTLNDNKPKHEYITENIYNIQHYDYVYDCNINSNIKRISKDYIEHIKSPGTYIAKINNFYEEPRIYTITNIKSQSSWVDIGRTATKTQMKQEDIIQYLIDNE